MPISYFTRVSKNIRFLTILGVFAFTQVKADSLSLLFDVPVEEYTLHFYQSNWQSLMTSNYSASENLYVPARFSDGTITLDSVGVRYKGNSSYNAALMSPKKPYKIKFDEYKIGQNYYNQGTLNFSNVYGDPSFLREVIAYDIHRKYMPTPRANFATISVGTTQANTTTLIGLYTQVEQIDKDFLEDWFVDDLQNLFKAGDAGANLVYLGRDPSLYSGSLELKTNEELADWTGMARFLTFVNDSNNAQWCSEVGNYMNLNRVTSFLALSMAMGHFDSYIGSGRNFYMYQANANGFMTFIPWDLNLAFGGYSNNWNVYTRSALAAIPTRPLFTRIMACENLRHMYLGYIKDVVTTHGSVERVQVMIDSLADIIRPYVTADPNKFYTLAQFESNLTSKLTTASGSIPGLIEYLTTRNALMLAEADSLLPDEYVLPLKQTHIKPINPTIQRKGTLIQVGERIYNMLGRAIGSIHE